MLEYLKQKFKDHRTKWYKNVDFLYIVARIRTFLGASVFRANISVGDHMEHQLDYLGLLCFVFWYGLYFYCSYISYMEGQTILRLLYDTKLKQYGDSVQSILALIYVLYVMWKIPFDLSKGIGKSQELANIDKIIRGMCEPIDTTTTALVAFVTTSIKLALIAIKMFGLWMILRNLEAPVPWGKLFEAVYVEMLVLMIACHYCFYLIMVKERYKIVNKILRAVRDKNSREYYFYVRERRLRNEQKALLIQEKYVCEKIKTCANIVSMLYNCTKISNRKFGVALVFTMFFCLVTITLNLFYLMEATASGLFHDVPKYCVFLFYVFWHIIVAISVVYAIVCLCELTTAEAKTTGFVVHQIINNNAGTAITSEAMQLSLQLLHQIPVFTARGLYKLDYLVILEGARSVVTFLVMLIQFVTDPPSQL